MLGFATCGAAGVRFRGRFRLPLFLHRARRGAGREWNPKKWGELITSVILRKSRRRWSGAGISLPMSEREREREKEGEGEAISDVVSATCARNNSGERGGRQVLKRASISLPTFPSDDEISFFHGNRFPAQVLSERISK